MEKQAHIKVQNYNVDILRLAVVFTPARGHNSATTFPKAKFIAGAYDNCLRNLSSDELATIKVLCQARD